MHDAHLLEGGKTFLVVKTLIAGSLRGQSLEETLDYLEAKVIGQYQCHLPESRPRFEAMETSTRQFLADIRRNL